ncbi:MAG: hypothetical protein KDB01_27265 [Planctomycetaceae bacterium]|nr:hypothetical protein [Planctomycetaceae bacterium]
MHEIITSGPKTLRSASRLSQLLANGIITPDEFVYNFLEKLVYSDESYWEEIVASLSSESLSLLVIFAREYLLKSDFRPDTGIVLPVNDPKAKQDRIEWLRPRYMELFTLLEKLLSKRST